MVSAFAPREKKALPMLIKTQESRLLSVLVEIIKEKCRRDGPNWTQREGRSG